MSEAPERISVESDEFTLDPTQSKVNIGHIKDPIYIGEAKPFGTSVVQDIDAQLAEQVEWVKRLADDLIAAEGREARLEAKLAKAVEALRGWIDFANEEGMPVLLSDLEAAELTSSVAATKEGGSDE